MKKLPIEILLNKIVEETKSFEFETFILGILNPEKLAKEVIQKRYYKLKVELGRALVKTWKDRAVEFANPHLRIDLCPIQGELRFTFAPIFLAGRYLKLSREITSSYWCHNACGGKGCEECGFKGTLFDFSIEEFLEKQLQPKFQSEGRKFHAMGREDIDVLMLGKGRPFIFEIFQPKKRFIELSKALKEMEKETKAKILYLHYVNRSDVKLVKTEEPAKVYLAKIPFAGEPPNELILKLKELEGITINQQTPLRVIRRRANINRKRKILELKLEKLEKDFFTLKIQTESGTYIKELISGDQDRTKPSISSQLQQELICRELDVLEVLWNAPWEKDISF